MATNSLLTTHLVTNRALRILKGNLNFVKRLNRDYQGEFAKSGMKVGEVISIRKPIRYAGRTGAVMQPEASVETYVPLTLNNIFGVDAAFSLSELTLSMDDFAKRVIEPAMNTISQQIEAKTLSAMTDSVYNVLGTPGTLITDSKIFNKVNAVINSNGGTQSTKRTICLDPYGMANAQGLFTNFFNPQPTISEQYKTGLVSQALNMDWYLANNMQSHTVGTYGGTPLVNGGSQTGSSLVTDGWTPTTTSLNVGDVFTIANVYSVNPNTKATITGVLQQFVVTAATVTDGSGNSTIAISPSIVTTGAYQNVSAGPADNAAITVVGASGVSTTYALAFEPDAFTFVSVPFDEPAVAPGLTHVEQDPETGIYLRATQCYDYVNNVNYFRFDVLYGFAATYPQLAVKLATV